MLGPLIRTSEFMFIPQKNISALDKFHYQQPWLREFGSYRASFNSGLLFHGLLLCASQTASSNSSDPRPESSDSHQMPSQEGGTVWGISWEGSQRSQH